MAAEKQKCRSCGADIYWLEYPTTGKRAPINAEPEDKGNVLVDLEKGTYSIAKMDQLGKVEAHKNHFVTCPQSHSWARK